MWLSTDQTKKRVCTSIRLPVKSTNITFLYNSFQTDKIKKWHLFNELNKIYIDIYITKIFKFSTKLILMQLQILFLDVCLRHGFMEFCSFILGPITLSTNWENDESWDFFLICITVRVLINFRLLIMHIFTASLNGRQTELRSLMQITPQLFKSLTVWK